MPAFLTATIREGCHNCHPCLHRPTLCVKMKDCAACTREIGNDNYLQCTKCSEIFHYLCLNIRPENIGGLSSDALSNWICPTCMIKQPKGYNSESTARPSTPTSTAEISFNNVNRRKAPLKIDTNVSNISCDYVHRSELRELLREEISNILKSCTSELTVGVKTLNEQISNLKSSVEFMSEKFDKISEEFKHQQQQFLEIKKENDVLRNEMNTLNNKFNQLDQLSRASSLEIQCLPERKLENVVNIVKQLEQTIKHKLDDQDIQYCSRVAKLDPTSTRPRTIVVKLSSPRLRDTVMSAVSRYNKTNKENKLNSADFGFGTEDKKPVFVVENLSAENKQLHAAARKRGKDLKYKFTWIRSGRVYMRKSDTSEAILIRNHDTLEKLK